MILDQFAADIIKDLQGGRQGSYESLLAPDMYEKINQGRATIIAASYPSGKPNIELNMQWVQPFLLAYDSTIQDSPAYVRFAIPSTLIDLRLFQITSFDTKAQFITTDAFQIGNFMAHKLTKPLPNRMYVVTDGIYLTFYGNPLIGQGNKKLKGLGVFADPTQVPVIKSDGTTRAFDVENDQYPLDVQSAQKVRSLIMSVLAPELTLQQKPVNNTDNAQERP